MDREVLKGTPLGWMGSLPLGNSHGCGWLSSGDTYGVNDGDIFSPISIPLSSILVSIY